MTTPAASEHTPIEITQLLRRWQGGDLVARERLVEAVYTQVRAIAGRSVRSNPGGSLGATELAHEALMRLLGGDAAWEDRRHFFNVVAQATRQILVDAARRRMRDKRGGGAEAVSLSAADDVAQAEDEDLLRLHAALQELEGCEPRKAQVLELTYFGGLEREDVARALEISVPTVDRDLRFGKAWLKRALES